MVKREARAFAIGLVAAALAARCNDAPPPSPAACAPIKPFVSGLPADTVYGFADLHSHLGIEVAFQGRMIWGTALDDAPVDASLLPSIAPCPVETHDRDATSPVDRAVGEQLFPKIAGLTGFAHAPVGSVDYRPTSAWPNGRDVIHQAMNVASVRRAYEGGLRLMFASTTDDQAISALLSGPNMHDGFVPDPAADLKSAELQLDFITQVVARNSDWMAIARTPRDARQIIQSGKLALVLSLEMEGLRESDVDLLRSSYGVRHIVPIHLIDNDIGGTAANGTLFNDASAATSSIYRSDGAPNRFMDVAGTPLFDHVMGLPQQIGTLTEGAVYAELDDVPYSTYSSMCYEPLAACSTTTAAPTSFIELGHENARGLCSTLADCDLVPRPGAQRIRRMMDEQMLIDLSHMGRRSVGDSLDIDPTYPLLATHGDIAHLCAGNPTQPPCDDAETRGPISERSIEGEAAREIVARGGVLGLGTGMKVYATRGLFAARGGPLFTLTPTNERATACVSPGTPGCADVPQITADPRAPIDALQIQTAGGISGTQGNAQPFVRVEMRANAARDAYQRRVFVQPMSCTSQSCTGSVALGQRDQATLVDGTPACQPLDCATAGACGTSAYTIDDIESVTLEWLYLACDLACQQNTSSSIAARQCQSTWSDDASPHWTITQVDLSASSSAQTTPIVSLGPTIASPLADLHKDRGTLLVYDRDDRPESNADVLATGHLLRVTMQTAPDSDMAGASPDQPGVNVCFALRQLQDGACVSTATPLPDGATECDSASGWWNLNQRGEWASGVELFSFARFAGPETSVCGLDVNVLDWQDSSPTTSLAIDEVKIESIEDPLGHFVRRYANVERQVADGTMGVFAIGTDFNGLNGTMDISETPLPSDARAASACGVSANASDDPAPMSPMRFRNADGTAGAEVRIDERGLGTYGMLADMLAIIDEYPGCGHDVHDSLMLSAEATLRAWEAIVDPQTLATRPPLPKAAFACGPPPGIP